MVDLIKFHSQKIFLTLFLFTLSACNHTASQINESHYEAAAQEEQGITPEYDPQSDRITNWRLEALRHLRKQNGGKYLKITDAELSTHKYLRCIKLNNYWCLKDLGWGWQGRLGLDSDLHTGFSSAVWGARAAVRNFRTAYVKHGRESALEILSVYASSSDCVGSDAARDSDGNCIEGNNAPEAYARTAIRGITDDINEDLRLFNDDGSATENLRIFLRNMSGVEIGQLFASPELIDEGIEKERNSLVQD